MADAIVVTGTSGFLGGAIARRLSQVNAARGRRDLAAVLESSDASTIVHAGFHVDFAAMTGRVEDDPHRNLDSFARVLRFAEQGGRRVVFLSAAGVLGVSDSPRTRNELDVGRTDRGFEPYRATRYIQEKLACEAMLVASSVPWTILYPTTVYGPGMARGVLDGAASARPLRMVPPGGTSWLALDDFLGAVDRVLATPVHERFVLSSGNLRFADLARAGAEARNSRARVVVLPPKTRTLLGAVPPRLRRMSTAVVDSAFGFKYYSSQHATRTLGWVSNTSIDDALRSALAGQRATPS
jgi:nucleoside-diphosphate-sugar epimerase